MPLGLLAARAAGNADAGAMMTTLGFGASGALLLALGALTTNFVNIYLSALAWKSLVPRASQQASVWSIGLVGALLSLLSRAWLERYAEFVLVLGGILVPAGAVLMARLVLRPRAVDVAALYAESGPYSGWQRRGLAAWAVGSAAYFACAGFGGTLPSLLAALLTYEVLGLLERG
jgi:purine-cytosine permease-like protein